MASCRPTRPLTTRISDRQARGFLCSAYGRAARTRTATLAAGEENSENRAGGESRCAHQGYQRRRSLAQASAAGSAASPNSLSGLSETASWSRSRFGRIISLSYNRTPDAEPDPGAGRGPRQRARQALLPTYRRCRVFRQINRTA